MAKKKGKKEKKDKKPKPEALSHSDREKYLQTIRDLEHRIEWRRHRIRIIDENRNLLEEACNTEKKDKAESVAILEQAVAEHQLAAQNRANSAPEVENRIRRIQKESPLLLAATLRDCQRKTVRILTQMNKMRGKLEAARRCDFNKDMEVVLRLGKQFESNESPESRGYQKILDQDRRRSEAYSKIVDDVWKSEKKKFDTKLKEDEIMSGETQLLQKEHTRFSSKLQPYNHLLKHLEGIRKKESAAIGELKRSLEVVKEPGDRKPIQELAENEIAIFESMSKNGETTKNATVEIGSVLEEDEALKALEEDQDSVIMSLKQIKEREIEIECLEGKLSEEETFGRGLQGFVERAQEVMENEAKTALISTGNGPPERKKTVGELLTVFEEATKYINERRNSTMV